jgi:N-acyl-D-aspartate/D-glutamate deacylase
MSSNGLPEPAHAVSKQGAEGSEGTLVGQAGGAWLRDPQIRARVEEEMTTPNDEWENLFLLAGPENIRITEFASDEQRPYTGRTLAEVAHERGLSSAQTAMQLVVEDGSRVEAAFLLMSEENVHREVGLPWMSFCSDSIAAAPEGVFLQSRPHPRAYGSFARLLGRYVREAAVVPVEEAVRRLSSLPADNLHLRDRGRLLPGHFADVIVFDPATVADHATFDDPHRYATRSRARARQRDPSDPRRRAHRRLTRSGSARPGLARAGRLTSRSRLLAGRRGRSVVLRVAGSTGSRRRCARREAQPREDAPYAPSTASEHLTALARTGLVTRRLLEA